MLNTKSLLKAAVFLAPTSSLFAISIQGFTSATNDRFENSSSFVADGFDLSGVGRSSNGTWATMVSSNVFVSSNHFRPSDTSTITFYETNDPTGSSVTVGVADGSGQRVSDSDLWVGVLDTPLSGSYGNFSFATQNASTFLELTAAGYGGANAYLFGNSPTAFSTDQNVAVGRNILDGYLNVSAAGTTDDAILATDNDPGGVQYEALLQGGDSGGPMFVDIAGELVFVGTNWIVASS